MDLALLGSAAFMGLAGTPHCAAMCGSPCAALTGGSVGARAWCFHLGRLLAYSAAGALMAAGGGVLQQWADASAALKPLWTALQAAALALGLWLLLTARQPAWLSRLGRVQPADPGAAVPVSWRGLKGPLRSAAGGLAWVAWPCALLQSALLVAALAPSAASGATVMAVFGLASMPGLVAGPVLWAAWRHRRVASARAQDWALRIAGAGLAGASVWALAHGLGMHAALTCNA